ncbi:hypothetical protein PsYK624_013480 [Phanerochaete sordida]|uniref:Uncharacterized protein n=1 Tax=Phanerochaete sordida TaxID=48140 RepID=A0A9P3L889_9APHY|nr:hypothetical protein PsYK624_013480 [Phanerochaete sordida]
MPECATDYLSLFLGLCRAGSTSPSSHGARILRRDLSVASAASFIIVLAVGFIGVLIVCAASCTCYRRRIARERAGLTAWATPDGDVVRPRLWDVHLPELEKAHDPIYDSDRSAEWDQVLPLAVKVETEEDAESPEELKARPERAVRRQTRLAAWFKPWPSRIEPSTSSDSLPQIRTPTPRLSPPAEIAAVEVAVFIAMPAPRALALDRPPGEQGPWAECAVGTSIIPYRGARDDFVARAAS